MTLARERILCSDHMLKHFVNSDDIPGKAFCGYFVTSVLGNKVTNIEIAATIIDKLFSTKMNEIIISQDRNEPSALVLYRNFSDGEITGLFYLELQ